MVGTVALGGRPECAFAHVPDGRRGRWDVASQSGAVTVLAAMAQHDDEVQELREAGVQAAFDLSSEAGEGFARHALEVAEGTLQGAPPKAH